jgi:uncharacterized protein DUF6011
MTQIGGYENAPATRMVATTCAVCGRPLVDSVSVETGIGPECRRKHGYTVDVAETARTEGNAIVYSIAAGAVAGPTLVSALLRLRALGFDRLADVITRRRGGLEITEGQSPDGAAVLIVKAPYREEALGAWRMVPGRRWDRDAKCNTVPATDKGRAALWALLRTYYRGEIGMGPKGAFLVS